MSTLPLISSTLPSPGPLLLATSQVIRGSGSLASSGRFLAQIGSCPFVLGGKQGLAVAESGLQQALGAAYPTPHLTHPDCSEAVLDRLLGEVEKQRPDYGIAIS